MKTSPDTPQWLAAARGAWPKAGAPAGLDPIWSPKWISRFLVYVERRNQGALPDIPPAPGLADSFGRFLREKWGVEDWQLEQALRAVDWLLATAADEPEASCGELESAEIPFRPPVEMKLAAIPTARAGLPFLDSPAELPAFVRAECRKAGLALSTEKTYAQWAGRFVGWWDDYPGAADGAGSAEPPIGAAELAVSVFLDYLAVVEDVSAATQRQALNALVFVLRKGFGAEPGTLAEYRPGRVSRYLPDVVTQQEAVRLLDCAHPKVRLIAKLLYGSGARISEAIRLRVQDLRFEEGVVVIRRGKGGKDRRTVLPRGLIDPLKAHLVSVKALFEQDMRDGRPGVYLPNQLERKYPNAPKEWIWQYVFPSTNIQTDPRSGLRRRHHVSEKLLQKEVKRAAGKAGIDKRVTPHVLRHSFATHMLENGYECFALLKCRRELLGTHGPGAPRPQVGGDDYDIHPRDEPVRQAQGRPGRGCT